MIKNSRKLSKQIVSFLTNVDVPADGNVLAPILQIVNIILQVCLNPDEILIACPL